MRLAASLLLVFLASPAIAQTAMEGAPGDPAKLVEEWTAADATCRNASTPAFDAIGACQQRDRFAKLLALVGQCFDKGWSPCGKERPVHVSVAQFYRARGVFVVPAMLNGGTQVTFVADSGASIVQIPQEAADAMRSAGTLTDADFSGQRRFVVADGRGLQQKMVRVRSLKIGDRVMENVLASVGAPHSQALLGQSFLGRLSWWKIDNVRNRFEFEYTGSF